MWLFAAISFLCLASNVSPDLLVTPVTYEALCSGSIFSHWAARGDCTCLCPQCRACVPVSRPPANTPGTQGGERDRREESQPIYILQRYTATKHRPGTFHNQTANIRSSNRTKVRLPPRFIPLFLAVYVSTLMSISCHRG